MVLIRHVRDAYNFHGKKIRSVILKKKKIVRFIKTSQSPHPTNPNRRSRDLVVVVGATKPNQLRPEPPEPGVGRCRLSVAYLGSTPSPSSCLRSPTENHQSTLSNGSRAYVAAAGSRGALELPPARGIPRAHGLRPRLRPLLRRPPPRRSPRSVRLLCPTLLDSCH